MRPAAQTIRLGTHHWQVRPLTLAQVQAIEPLVFGAAEAGTIASAIAIVRVALARDHAEAAADLESIESSAPEIAAAMADVLRLGRLRRRHEREGRAGGSRRGLAARIDWSRLYARLMANLAMAPAAIDEIPAHDAFALLAYWREHPPVAEILAAVHRIVPPAMADADDPSGIGGLITRFPDGNVSSQTV